MAAGEITKYAAELRGLLAGVGADATALVDLAMKGSNLQALADRAPGNLTAAEWQVAEKEWAQARDAFGAKLAQALLGPLAALPGLAELAADVGKIGTEGIHGGIDLGPVNLKVGSALLVIEPPKFTGATGPSPAVAIGPFPIGKSPQRCRRRSAAAKDSRAVARWCAFRPAPMAAHSNCRSGRCR